MAFRSLVRDLACSGLYPLQCRGKPKRAARYLCSYAVGFIFACATYCHLYKRRRQRHHDDDEKNSHKPKRAVAVTAHEEGNIAEHGDAIVAAIVMVSVLRFFTWASSWAMTPATSSELRRCSNPVVAQTAACAGLRPVAKALGCGLSAT